MLASDQTLLPFWPGQRSAGLLRPLKISWLWPLIDQPHHQVCAALTNNNLAASLNPGGRLAALLTAGASHPDADLTWVIDPALLSDVATMASPYQVGSKPNCTDAPAEPASTAAASWLAALKEVTPGQPTVITPYANVDMTALVHQGLTADLATAYDTGDAVADSVLGGKFGHEVAWPPGGTADLSVLTNLATAEHVGTVVLNSSEMPPANAGTAFQPDDAVDLAPGRGPAHDRAALRRHPDRGARSRRHQLREPAEGHRVRRQAAVPGRDGHDRRRGAQLRPADRGGAASGLEPVGRRWPATCSARPRTPRG